MTTQPIPQVTVTSPLDTLTAQVCNVLGLDAAIIRKTARRLLEAMKPGASFATELDIGFRIQGLTLAAERTIGVEAELDKIGADYLTTTTA